MDVTKPLPEDEFQRLVDNDIEMMYHYANTQKADDETGDIVVSKDTFFCSENDLYAEYSVRYTQRRTMYENDKLTLTDIPRLWNHKKYIYKDTHKVTSTMPSEIRRAEIPGTENDVEPVY